MLLGIDIGTSSLKLGAVDGDSGEFVAWSEARYELEHPAAGLSELPGERYWQAFCDALGQLGRQIDLSTVRALCSSSQAQTFVPVDHQGRCLQNAWTWIDNRAHRQAAELTDRFARDEMLARCGLDGVSAGSFAAMLKYLRQRCTDVYKHTWKFLHVASYLNYRLTGQVAWDANIASMGAVYDWQRDCWWQEMLDAIGIDVSTLPQVHSSGSIIGYVTQQAAAATSLPVGAAVVTGSNDQPANALGAGLTDERRFLIVLGTALIGFRVIDSYTLNINPSGLNGMWSVYPIAGKSCQLGYTNSGCGTFDWCKRLVADDVAHDQVFDHISKVPLGSNGVTSLIDLDGRGWPTNSSYRGVLAGLSRKSDRWTILRAVVESTALSLRELIEQLGWDVADRSVRIVGGAARSAVWVQMIADVLGVNLERLAHSQSGVVGSAIMAGVACGTFDSYSQAVEKVVRTADRFEPLADRQSQYDDLYERFKRLRHSADNYYNQASDRQVEQ